MGLKPHYLILFISTLYIQNIRLLDAAGVIETNFVKFRNLEGKRFDGKCCDEGGWWSSNTDDCSNDCDHSFVICMGNKSESSSMNSCEFGRRETGTVGGNRITFDGTMGQTPNPIKVPFDKWPGLVKLKIDVIDEDDDDEFDFVDHFEYQYSTIDLRREIDTAPKSLILTGSRSRFDLKLKVFCDAGFYGPDCSVFCRESDDDTGHFNCDPRTGAKICKLGWEGTDCLENIDDCAAHRCYYGSTCIDGINSYSCVCPPGRTGFTCEAEVNECASSPCQNGGHCLDAANSFYCQCQPGFVGPLCEINVDECMSAPCLNGGLCQDGIASVTCLCPVGFTGERCEQDVNECDPNPCVQAMNCTDLVADYRCDCFPGYSGKNCDYNINECTSLPCQNDGWCIDEVNSYTCVCQYGYTGSNCELSVDFCDPNNCRNGGTCQSQEEGFLCDCLQGFSGNWCEMDIDECDHNPCARGRCINTFGGFICECDIGFGGSLCKENIDDCALSDNPCHNNGTCVDLIGAFKCSCLAGYSGSSCEINVNECDNVLCQNNGTCTDKVNDFKCECASNFIGRFCESEEYTTNTTVGDIMVGLTSDYTIVKQETRKDQSITTLPSEPDIDTSFTAPTKSSMSKIVSEIPTRFELEIINSSVVPNASEMILISQMQQTTRHPFSGTSFYPSSEESGAEENYDFSLSSSDKLSTFSTAGFGLTDGITNSTISDIPLNDTISNQAKTTDIESITNSSTSTLSSSFSSLQVPTATLFSATDAHLTTDTFSSDDGMTDALDSANEVSISPGVNYVSTDVTVIPDTEFDALSGDGLDQISSSGEYYSSDVISPQNNIFSSGDTLSENATTHVSDDMHERTTITTSDILTKDATIYSGDTALDDSSSGDTVSKVSIFSSGDAVSERFYSGDIPLDDTMFSSGDSSSEDIYSSNIWHENTTFSSRGSTPEDTNITSGDSMPENRTFHSGDVQSKDSPTSGSVISVFSSGDMLSKDTIISSGDVLSQETSIYSDDILPKGITISSAGVITEDNDFTSVYTSISSGDSLLQETIISSGDVLSEDTYISSGDFLLENTVISSGDIVSSDTVTSSGDSLPEYAVISLGDILPEDSNILSGGTFLEDSTISSGDIQSRNNFASPGDILSKESLILVDDILPEDTKMSSYNILFKDTFTSPGDTFTEDTIISSGDSLSHKSIISSEIDTIVSSDDTSLKDTIVSIGNDSTEDTITFSGNSLPNEKDTFFDPEDLLPGYTEVSSGDILPKDTTISSGDILPRNTTILSGDSLQEDTAISSGAILPKPEGTIVSSGDILLEATAISSGDILPADAVISSGNILPEDTFISANTLSSGDIFPEDTVISSGDILSEPIEVVSGDTLSEETLISSGDILPEDALVSSGDIFSEDTVISSGDSFPENTAISSSDSFPEDTVISSGDGFPEDTVISSGDGFPEDTVISAGDCFPEDIVISSGDGFPENTVISSGDSSPEDTFISSGDGFPEDTVISSGDGFPEDTVISSVVGFPEDTFISSGGSFPKDTVVPSGEPIPEDTVISPSDILPENTVISSDDILLKDTIISSRDILPEDTVMSSGDALPEYTAMSSGDILPKISNSSSREIFPESYFDSSEDDLLGDDIRSSGDMLPEGNVVTAENYLHFVSSGDPLSQNVVSSKAILRNNFAISSGDMLLQSTVYYTDTTSPSDTGPSGETILEDKITSSGDTLFEDIYISPGDTLHENISSSDSQQEAISSGDGLPEYISSVEIIPKVIISPTASGNMLPSDTSTDDTINSSSGIVPKAEHIINQDWVESNGTVIGDSRKPFINYTQYNIISPNEDDETLQDLTVTQKIISEEHSLSSNYKTNTKDKYSITTDQTKIISKQSLDQYYTDQVITPKPEIDTGLQPIATDLPSIMHSIDTTESSSISDTMKEFLSENPSTSTKQSQMGIGRPVNPWLLASRHLQKLKSKLKASADKQTLQPKIQTGLHSTEGTTNQKKENVFTESMISKTLETRATSQIFKGGEAVSLSDTKFTPVSFSRKPVSTVSSSTDEPLTMPSLQQSLSVSPNQSRAGLTIFPETSPIDKTFVTISFNNSVSEIIQISNVSKPTEPRTGFTDEASESPILATQTFSGTVHTETKSSEVAIDEGIDVLNLTSESIKETSSVFIYKEHTGFKEYSPVTSSVAPSVKRATLPPPPVITPPPPVSLQGQFSKTVSAHTKVSAHDIKTTLAETSSASSVSSTIKYGSSVSPESFNSSSFPLGTTKSPIKLMSRSPVSSDNIYTESPNFLNVSSFVMLSTKPLASNNATSEFCKQALEWNRLKVCVKQKEDSETTFVPDTADLIFSNVTGETSSPKSFEIVDKKYVDERNASKHLTSAGLGIHPTTPEPPRSTESMTFTTTKSVPYYQTSFSSFGPFNSMTADPYSDLKCYKRIYRGRIKICIQIAKASPSSIGPSEKIATTKKSDSVSKDFTSSLSSRENTGSLFDTAAATSTSLTSATTDSMIFFSTMSSTVPTKRIPTDSLMSPGSVSKAFTNVTTTSTESSRSTSVVSIISTSSETYKASTTIPSKGTTPLVPSLLSSSNSSISASSSTTPPTSTPVAITSILSVHLPNTTTTTTTPVSSLTSPTISVTTSKSSTATAATSASISRKPSRTISINNLSSAANSSITTRNITTSTQPSTELIFISSVTPESASLSLLSTTATASLTPPSSTLEPTTVLSKFRYSPSVPSANDTNTSSSPVYTNTTSASTTIAPSAAISTTFNTSLSSSSITSMPRSTTFTSSLTTQPSTNSTFSNLTQTNPQTFLSASSASHARSISVSTSKRVYVSKPTISTPVSTALTTITPVNSTTSITKSVSTIPPETTRTSFTIPAITQTTTKPLSSTLSDRTPTTHSYTSKTSFETIVTSPYVSIPSSTGLTSSEDMFSSAFDAELPQTTFKRIDDEVLKSKSIMTQTVSSTLKPQPYLLTNNFNKNMTTALETSSQHSEPRTISPTFTSEKQTNLLSRILIQGGTMANITKPTDQPVPSTRRTQIPSTTRKLSVIRHVIDLTADNIYPNPRKDVSEYIRNTTIAKKKAVLTFNMIKVTVVRTASRAVETGRRVVLQSYRRVKQIATTLRVTTYSKAKKLLKQALNRVGALWQYCKTGIDHFVVKPLLNARVYVKHRFEKAYARLGKLFNRGKQILNTSFDTLKEETSSYFKNLANYYTGVYRQYTNEVKDIFESLKIPEFENT